MVCRELTVNCKPRGQHSLLLTATTQNDSTIVYFLDLDTHLEQLFRAPKRS